MIADILAARALADAADKAAEGATEGPWYPQDFTSPEVNDDPIARDVHVSCTWPDHISVASMGGGFHGIEDLEQARLDARFIAASRQLVPAMAATIRALADEAAAENARYRAEQDAKRARLLELSNCLTIDDLKRFIINHLLERN